MLRRSLILVVCLVCLVACIVPVSAFVYHPENLSVVTKCFMAVQPRFRVMVNTSSELDHGFLFDLPSVVPNGQDKVYAINTDLVSCCFQPTGVNCAFDKPYQRYGNLGFLCHPFPPDTVSSWSIDAVSVEFDSFVVKLDDPSVWESYFCMYASEVTVSLRYSAVINGRLVSNSWTQSHEPGYGWLLSSEFYNYLINSGVKKGSYVSIDYAYMYADQTVRKDHDSDLIDYFTFSTLCYPDAGHGSGFERRYFPNNYDMINQIRNASNSNSNPISLNVISDFIASGVSSFLDAPIFGKFLTLGGVFGLLFSVLVLVAVFKILK